MIFCVLFFSDLSQATHLSMAEGVPEPSHEQIRTALSVILREKIEQYRSDLLGYTDIGIIRGEFPEKKISNTLQI